MQVELLDRRSWRTRVELANAIFEYLEIFHNRQRRHSALGMLTPSRVRGSAQDSDSGLKSSNSTPQNPGQPRASTELRTVQAVCLSTDPLWLTTVPLRESYDARPTLRPPGPRRATGETDPRGASREG
jgi:hypothetical protein